MYKNPNEYKLINNELFIISGYKLFKYFNTYDSLYDVYIQKVNDSENIKINSKMFPYNNLVKLFLPNKKYHLDFNVEHLIKLDNKFLDAEITFFDKNGSKYILNRFKRVIKNLKGYNITLETNKNALIYFYKKMNYDYELGIIEFDKSQTGKIMKFNITNINSNEIEISIAKDFGFKGYYPMINLKCWEDISSYKNNTVTIYAENLYDKLDYEIYENEGEKYYIYIFNKYCLTSFNPKNYNLTKPIYINNLLNPKNKYNFEIIPSNHNGSIILNTINKLDINYQFMMCENKKIKFKIENPYGYSKADFNYSYPYELIVDIDQSINFYLSVFTPPILYHSFKSDTEFLFLYSTFSIFNYEDCMEHFISSKISINKILNKLHIKFYHNYQNCLYYYFIIFAKVDEKNNFESFSNPCYISKIINQNSNSIFTKQIFEETIDNNNLIFAEIDINELKFDKNNNIICTIMSNNILGKQLLDFYTPIEFKLKDKEAIEFKFGKEVVYNFKDKNFFKFEYIYENGKPGDIYFYFELSHDFQIYLIDDGKIQIFNYNKEENELFKLTLKKSGIYYINFVSRYIDIIIDEDKFMTFVPEEIIDTIDLTQRMYHINSIIETKNNYQYNKFKVKNLKEDKYVFFSYKIENELSYKFHNPFEVCNINKSQCTRNVFLYKFLKDNEYFININFINKKAKFKKSYDIYFYYPSYTLIPIFQDMFEYREEGYYTFSIPKIFIINMENKGNLTLYLQSYENIYLSSSDINITQNNLNNIKFIEDNNSTYILSEKRVPKFAIILVIPSIKNNNGIFIVANELLLSELLKLIIKSKNNAIILIENNIYEKKYNIMNPLELCNALFIISSLIDNIKVISVNNYKNYNYFEQNYYPIPLYIDKYEKSIDLEYKSYHPRYALFAVINDNIIQVYMSLIKIKMSFFNIFNQIFPFNLKKNPNIRDAYEFINLFFYECESKINIYIKKYFGGTEFYECNTDLIDKKNLTILTKPIPSCENKKSILNRIINLKGIKLLSIYLDYNSYQDIYVEIDDDKNTDIKISKTIEFFKFDYNLNHQSKYLKKGVEYNIAFKANHLIKLDIGFDAEVLIYKNKDILAKLNTTNPISILKGNNLKIKSNKDAMVYFYFKLSNKLIQTKIEPKKGKNIEIQINKGYYFFIDFGFEDYIPLDMLEISPFKIKKKRTIYLENPYDKLKTKLVEGEFLYLYTYNSKYIENKINITYSNNINNPKNEYTFYLIKSNSPKDEEEKSLIINNINMDYILYQIYFCTSSHPIKLYYKISELNENLLEFGGENQIFNKSIPHESIKLRFESTKDFIFSYSFIDDIDLRINNYEKWQKERVVNNKLYIEEIYKKNKKGNIISVIFSPNYRYSNTRYIILIASKDENNSLENFSNPCFITKLANEREDNIKLFNIYDIGENPIIKVDLNISDILNESNEYIINIISQELRFEKKLNFYSPKIFIPKELTYEGKEEEKEREKKVVLKLVQKENENTKIKNKITKLNKKVLYFCLIFLVVIIVIIVIIITYYPKKKWKNI